MFTGPQTSLPRLSSRSLPRPADSPREVDKSCEERLEAPVKRIFYLSAGTLRCTALRRAVLRCAVLCLCCAVLCAQRRLAAAKLWVRFARWTLGSHLDAGSLTHLRLAGLAGGSGSHLALLPAPACACLPAAAHAEGDTHEHEVAPAPNPRVLAELERADAVIYGMGSLYTSIAPSLVLKGVGECIAAAAVPKVGLWESGWCMA